jgi:uncharacterized membrane protein (DUF2068 family)
MIRCKTALHNSSDNLKTIKKHKVKNHSRGALRVVALFEATKGLLVVFVGFGLLAFIHQDLHSAAEQLVRHFHLNPARHRPMIFIDAAQHLTDRYLWAMAFSALIYSTVRFVEAYGLWHQRQWAKWFGLLSGAMYIPVELIAITRGATWPKVTVLVINASIVGYLAYALWRSRHDGKLV